MHFENRWAQSSDVDEIIDILSDGSAGEFDVGFLFLSLMTPEEVQEIVEGLRRNIAIGHILATTCSGVIGHDIEIEDQPAASLMLSKLPGVRISPFYMDQSQLKQMEGPEDWHRFFDLYPNEAPIFLIFPDPFLLDINHFLNGLNTAYPASAVAGGLASGANQPQGNTLVLNGTYQDQGVVGVALTGDIAADTVVSQGCRPVGEAYVVTKAERNVIFELGGRPFVNVLQEVVNHAEPHDQLLLQQAILIGVAMDETKHGHGRGDFLVRGLMRLDEKTGAGSIGDEVHTGQRVQFHVRDAEAAIEDLNALLSLQREDRACLKPEGALVFSCTGRGEHLFSCKSHDIGIIQKHLGTIPAAGFFCAGEIGRVGGQSFLHGYTNSMFLFYRPSAQKEI
ncbi:MAG: FIST N-terminal domain-containing protein [Nitrospiria bacterium]